MEWIGYEHGECNTQVSLREQQNAGQLFKHLSRLIHKGCDEGPTLVFNSLGRL